MSNHNCDKDKVFGVMEAPEADTEGMELRYEAEVGQEGDPSYLRQRVYRDANGKYCVFDVGGVYLYCKSWGWAAVTYGPLLDRISITGFWGCKKEAALCPYQKICLYKVRRLLRWKLNCVY